MAKTNFTKAEESISETLQKLNREKLLEMADEASGQQPQPASVEGKRILLISQLDRDLKRIYITDKDIYKQLGLKKKMVAGWIKDFAKFSEEEWAKVIKAKASLDEYIKNNPTKVPTDEQIVESQRSKHINKRFNVNDKWLPLK
jgi:hypothetical protein